MRVRFRAVPLCTCSFQVSHFAHIYQSHLISLVFKLSNEAITEIKFDVVQISEIPIQTKFFVACVASVLGQRTFFSILARHKLEQNIDKAQGNLCTTRMKKNFCLGTLAMHAIHAYFATYLLQISSKVFFSMKIHKYTSTV